MSTLDLHPQTRLKRRRDAAAERKARKRANDKAVRRPTPRQVADAIATAFALGVQRIAAGSRRTGSIAIEAVVGDAGAHLQAKGFDRGLADRMIARTLRNRGKA